jgi:hypothetical protein
MEGASQALDQIANWVRFADTKATILTAGTGVVLTMIVANAKTIVIAFRHGSAAAWSTGILAALTGTAVLWTLFWLVRAIGPRSRVTYSRLNRFAWPTLTKATVADIRGHVAQFTVDEDSWQQVLDLSKLAERKFDACGKAVWGFALVAVFAVSCVITAVSFTA